MLPRSWRLSLDNCSSMPNKTGRLVIVGLGETAHMAYEYFTHDSPFEVVAFSVERAFATGNRFLDRPVVHFEEVERHYDPAAFGMFVAISPVKLNRVRARLYGLARQKGYRLASYVSSKAFVWHDVEIGENCFILENNVLQHAVRIGDDVVLWSGNHIGHQSVIRSHCFLSSHVVIAGYCDIGESCFFGTNSCVGNNLTVASDCVIGIGSVITANTSPGQVYAGSRARLSPATSARIFGVDAEPGSKPVPDDEG
jgi:sugar O-acyltransferase (sialic acid O-acetyltransferase NeuD family)